MKISALRAAELAAPKQQRNWDWRAAANFICGGAGGGLLFWAAFAGLDPVALRVAVLLGLALIAGGLTCVWFEIGRPWRALNVYRHIATSWMTREAVVALLVFAAGGLALLTANALPALFAGVLGLGFLYSQARILAANKGIPAWRNRRSIPLMVATGLAEGAGFLACVLSLTSAGAGLPMLVGLIVLIGARALFWHRYLGALVADGAPDATLKVLGGIAARLAVFGHILPALFVMAAVAGMPGRGGLVFVAGIMAVAGGWFLKFTLVRRAAYTQGLALQHMPMRGQGAAGAAAKPGWKAMPGGKAG
jgi:phenylacetyl-CoA:acceptor oxidoreductase subunit 2